MLVVSVVVVPVDGSVPVVPVVVGPVPVVSVVVGPVPVVSVVVGPVVVVATVVDVDASVPIAAGGTAGGVVSRRRFGYAVGLLQHALGSAFGPVCGAWSKVIAIRPSSLYAAERLISGTTDFRNRLAAARPVAAPALHGASPPVAQAGGMMYANAGAVLALFTSLPSCPMPTSLWRQAAPAVSERK